MARRTWHNRGRPSRPSSRRMKRSARLHACQAPRNRAGLVWVGSILLDGNVASGRWRSLPEDWEYDKNPLDAWLASPNPPRGLHGRAAPRCVSVCMRATHPSRPYQAVGTDLCCRRLGWQLPAAAVRGLDNGTASCFIGYRSFPMAIRCPSDACFVLPLPCFHQTSYTAHKTSQSPRTTGRVGESWSSDRGCEGGSTGKARSSTSPMISCQGNCGAARVLGPSVLLGMSATCWAPGARELRRSSAAVGRLLRGPMADRCRAVCALLVALQGAQFGNPRSRQTGRYLVLSIGNAWACGRSAEVPNGQMRSEQAPLLMTGSTKPCPGGPSIGSQSCWRTSSHTRPRQRRPTPGSPAISDPPGSFIHSRQARA